MLNAGPDHELDLAQPPEKAAPLVCSQVSKGFKSVETAGAVALSEQTQLMLAVRDQRDRAAFGALFDFFAPRLKAMAMRTGLNADAAEDLVQDVLLTAWRKAHLFDPARAQVSAWIYQIARNRQVDIVRKEKRPMPEALKHADDTTVAADQALALDQESGLLRQAIRNLPEGQREIVEQAYLGDLSHAEIRDATGLPLGTIKSRIRLGLERLRHELKDLRTS